MLWCMFADDSKTAVPTAPFPLGESMATSMPYFIHSSHSVTDCMYFCYKLSHIVEICSALQPYHFCTHTPVIIVPSNIAACNSEQEAIRVLGYTQASWDNLSRKEQQPWSSIKHWSSLTADEKAAARVFGFTNVTWDNESGSERQPSAFLKDFAELTFCSAGQSDVLLL